MFANYHTHTYRCRHASGTEEEYILTAIDRGVKILGFSDHCPLVFPEGICGDNVVGSRMATNEIADYFDVLTSLKKKYQSKIEIHIGFEMEYHPRIAEETLPLLRQFPTEYLILGQHWLWDEVDPTAPHPTSAEERLDEYVKLETAAIRSGLYRYVAHPDFTMFANLKRRGDLTPYAERLSPILDAAKSMDIPLEYNLLGQFEGRVYPDPAFWRTVADSGVKVMIGCDVHSPDRMANPTELAIAEKALSDLGIQPQKTLEF